MTENKPNFCAVVSIHKSGTHLVARLMKKLGYETVGHGMPVNNLTPESGVPIVERDLEFMFSTQKQHCFFTHSAPLFVGDYGTTPALLRLWTKHKFPLIFNYRDPRAVVCSFIDYVLKKGASKEYTVTPFTSACADIFGSVGEDERIDIAIDILEDYLVSSYQKHIWLLKHPQVCAICYEDLCGPKGGGTIESQIKTIEKVSNFLSCKGNVTDISNYIYSEKSRTFNIGKAYGWKDRFSESQVGKFNIKYGDVIELFSN